MSLFWALINKNCHNYFNQWVWFTKSRQFYPQLGQRLQMLNWVVWNTYRSLFKKSLRLSFADTITKVFVLRDRRCGDHKAYLRLGAISFRTVRSINLFNWILSLWFFFLFANVEQIHWHLMLFSFCRSLFPSSGFVLDDNYCWSLTLLRILSLKNNGLKVLKGL